MTSVRVFNETRGVLLIDDGRLADTFWLRLRGLLGSAPLEAGEGLVLAGEKSIHTLFMSFPIDVVYADKDCKVIRTASNMVPYRIGPFVSKAAYILEMPIGTILQTSTVVDDQLRFDY